MAYVMHALIVSAIVVIGYQIDVVALQFDIGVCYGMLGNNLPHPTKVIAAYKKFGINKIRLFDSNAAALNALRKQGIKVTVGIRNEDLPTLAGSQLETSKWFDKNVGPYLTDIAFETITVGNEIIPGEYAPFVLPTMQNLQNILAARWLDGIKVSTVLSADTLAVSFPPSKGSFSAEAALTLRGVLKFLSNHKFPLAVNVYPYFAYAADPQHIRLDYALFNTSQNVFYDGNNSYTNMYDAMLDGFISAMEGIGFYDLDLLITETGWPNGGNDNLTTPALAYRYNYRFVRHIQHNGTPKRPFTYNSGFIFAFFNENLKPVGEEQHFGIMYPNLTSVYPL